MLILSWVNIFKRKSTRVPGKLSFTQYSEPALRRTLHKDIHLLLYASFFIRTIVRFTAQRKQRIMFSFSMKHSYLLTRELLLALIILKSLERATVGNYMHVRSNVLRLVMTPIKLMQYVYVTSFFCKTYKGMTWHIHTAST